MQLISRHRPGGTAIATLAPQEDCMNTTTIGAIALAALLAAGSGASLTGCKEGAGERLGQKIDGNDDIVRDKLKRDGAGESAGKKIDRAVDDITK